MKMEAAVNLMQGLLGQKGPQRGCQASTMIG